MKDQALGLLLVCWVFVVSSASAPASSAERPVVEWMRQWGTGGADRCLSVAVDDADAAFVTGILDNNSNTGGDDGFLTKYDSDGLQEWHRPIASARRDVGHDVAVDADGDAYVVGWTLGSLSGAPNPSGRDMFVSKYDSAGSRLWIDQIGVSMHAFGQCVGVNDAGFVGIAGTTRGAIDGGGPGTGSEDVFAMKYSSSGVNQWVDQERSEPERGSTDVLIDDLGNVYVAEWTMVPHPDSPEAVSLTKYDSNGQKLWSSSVGVGLGVGSRSDLCIDGEGNVSLAAYLTGSLGFDLFVTTFDASGAKTSTLPIGMPADPIGYPCFDERGCLYVAGEIEGDFDGNLSEGGLDVFLTKYDPDGAKLWTGLFGTEGDDYAGALCVQDERAVWVAGLTLGTVDGASNLGGTDLLLTKVSVVPEPSSLVMVFCGLAGLMALGRTRR